MTETAVTISRPMRCPCRIDGHENVGGLCGHPDGRADGGVMLCRSLHHFPAACPLCAPGARLVLEVSR